MSYRITQVLLCTIIGLVVLTGSVAAQPRLNWVDVEPECHSPGDSVTVLANVTLPVPCYTAEYHIAVDHQDDFHIGLELIRAPGACFQVEWDTTFQIAISLTCLYHAIEVYILGEPTGLETFTSCALQGDVNFNEVPYEISDFVRMINFAFRGYEMDERDISCWRTTADLNRDRRVNLVDFVWMRQIITGDRRPTL